MYICYLLTFTLISRECVLGWTIDCRRESNAICSVEDADEPPWSDDNSRTASFVMNATCLLRYNNPSQARITFQWTQKVSDLQQGIVHGYGIELSLLKPAGEPIHFVLRIKKGSWSKRVSQLVTFRFHDRGYTCNTGDKYAFRIDSLPMYRKADNPNSKSRPCMCLSQEARGKDIGEGRKKDPVTYADRMKTKLIGRKGDPVLSTDRMETKHVGYSLSASLVYVSLGTCCGIMFLLFVMAALVLDRKSKSVNNRKMENVLQSQIKRILIISSGGRFRPVVTRFMTILQKQEGIEVLSNLRQGVRIGNTGLLSWATNAVSGASVVIFMLADGSELTPAVSDGTGECRQVIVSIRLAENRVAMGSVARGKFLAVDLNGCLGRDQLQFFDHFKLPGDLDALLRCVLPHRHKYVQSKDRKGFISLLTKLQGLYFASDELMLKDQNDLNASPECSPADEQYSAFNIVQDESVVHLPPSLTTNDFNIPYS